MDALYKEGERTGDVDVPKYVETMRNSRMNMIQGEVSRDHGRYINMNYFTNKIPFLDVYGDINLVGHKIKSHMEDLIM